MRNATADERKKIIELINKNKSMFYMSGHAKSERITITDTTDIRPGYGAESYVAVLPIGKKNSVEWYNPSGDRRDDWHCGHSTIIVTNKDFTKVRKVRGMYSAEDNDYHNGGGFRYSSSIKTNYKYPDPFCDDDIYDDDWAIGEADEYRYVDEDIDDYCDDDEDEVIWNDVFSNIPDNNDTYARVSHDMPSLDESKKDKKRSTASGVRKGDIYTLIVILFIVCATTSIPIPLTAACVINSIATFILVFTRLRMRRRDIAKDDKADDAPDYQWVPSVFRNYLENSATVEKAKARLGDVKAIIESSASEKVKNESITRIANSIKVEEADTSAGDYYASTIASMWDGKK